MSDPDAPHEYINDFSKPPLGWFSPNLLDTPTPEPAQMNPEEAATALLEFLEAHAEFFRNAPSVFYVITDVAKARDVRHYVQIFAASPQGEVESLDFWLVKAAEVPRGTRTRILDGQYTPEVGHRMGEASEGIRVEVRDLLVDALAVALGEQRAADFVSTFKIARA